MRKFICPTVYLFEIKYLKYSWKDSFCVSGTLYIGHLVVMEGNWQLLLVKNIKAKFFVISFISLLSWY